jgi:hypothetical protein
MVIDAWASAQIRFRSAVRIPIVADVVRKPHPGNQLAEVRRPHRSAQAKGEKSVARR